MKSLLSLTKFFCLAYLTSFLFFLPTEIKAAASGCKTVSGATPDVECIFPFTWQGMTHNACTIHQTSDPDKVECATKVDADGAYIEGNWGACGPECPVEEGCWAHNGKKCVFPFKDWDGQTHHHCTSEKAFGPIRPHNKQGRAWCGTEKTANLTDHNTWGICGLGCPMPGKRHFIAQNQYRSIKRKSEIFPASTHDLEEHKEYITRYISKTTNKIMEKIGSLYIAMITLLGVIALIVLSNIVLTVCRLHTSKVPQQVTPQITSDLNVTNSTPLMSHLFRQGLKIRTIGWRWPLSNTQTVMMARKTSMMRCTSSQRQTTKDPAPPTLPGPIDFDY